MRDRVLAQRDLADLFADATRDPENRDVLSLLEDRRESTSFRVEQPCSATPLDAELRTEAMNAVPALVRALDTLDEIGARPSPRAARRTRARRALRRSRERARRRPAARGADRRARRGCGTTAPNRATNEETLAAAYDAAPQPTDSARRIAARALLSDAVALRAFAQERPWFPGDSTVSAATWRRSSSSRA